MFFKKKLKYDYYIKPELKNPGIPLIILLFVLIIGTTGYLIIWKDIPQSNLVDSIYMTFTTITTLGYGEIYPLGNSGRIFTMIIATAGIASLFYLFSTTMENLVTLQIYNYRGKRKMIKQIEMLENHIIVVGYGKVGQLAAHELLAKGEKFVLIDENLLESEFPNLKDKLLIIKGDAREDETLYKAGIDRARGMIVTTPNPATTVFVTISAKVLNPKIYLIARSDEQNDNEKLKRAGADEVVNPYEIGGKRLVNLMVNPQIVNFFETSFGNDENSLNIQKITLNDGSHWFNKSLTEIDARKKTGVTILAVIRDGIPESNPDSSFVIRKGDEIVVMGKKEELERLEKMVM